MLLTKVMVVLKTAVALRSLKDLSRVELDKGYSNTKFKNNIEGHCNIHFRDSST
jgi:hypothetical protein